jgi:diguanylate cyclase
VATGDLATITSAHANHDRRIGASAMLFVGLDGKVVADTLASDRVPRPFEFSKLVQGAHEVGRLASSLNHMRDGIAERERRILKLAYHDPLTDLANRSKFSQRLAQSIGEVDSSQRGVSILVMDLDRFKYVNDALAHCVGDHVLLEVGKRLLEAAPYAACIARLGGDEIAVLLAGAPTARAVDIARSINRALEQPIPYLDQPLDVGTSIGVAHYPEHGDDAPALICNADIAMYVSKRDKSGCAIYEWHYDTTQQRHLSLLGELRQAAEGRQLRLYYQPKVSLTSLNVSAVEALVRWILAHRQPQQRAGSYADSA